MPKATDVPQERKLREPAPDEQEQPTHEAGGPMRPRPRRERVTTREALREG